jgi:transposase
MKSEPCPKILGIDEHFFTRKAGFATTLADLKNRKVYDVALGRSEASLKDYLDKLEGKDDVNLICMDLAETYRNIAKNHFPNAKIVADRFHVIKLVNHHFLATWRQLDPIGSKNRGLLSLMRRHHDRLKPEQKLLLQEYFKEHQAMALIYEFKQKLTDLLRKKSQTFQQCKVLAPMLLDHINKLKESEFQCLKTLGETLCSWQEEIACMWRYTRNNGITEGFHNKMEMISRQAFGFRNFNNYRLRVRVMCA